MILNIGVFNCGTKASQTDTAAEERRSSPRICYHAFYEKHTKRRTALTTKKNPNHINSKFCFATSPNFERRLEFCILLSSKLSTHPEFRVSDKPEDKRPIYCKLRVKRLTKTRMNELTIGLNKSTKINPKF